MSLTSVINQPALTFEYPESDFYGLYRNIVARGIYAYNDTETNTAQSLLLGATSNLDLEAVNDLNIYVKDSGNVNIYASTYSNSTRSNTSILSIYESNNGGVTVIGAPELHQISFVPTDAEKTVAHGDLRTFTSNNASYIDSIHTDIRIKKRLVTDGTLVVGQNANVVNNMTIGNTLKANGSMFSKNMNVVKDIAGAGSAEMDQVGFALNINDSNQLEIIKIIRYNDSAVDSAKTVVKRRVAAFDNRQTSSNVSSDSAYSDFGTIYNVDVVSGSNVITSLSESGNITGDLTVTGTVSAGKFVTTSDRRLKEDITPLGDALEKVAKLNGFTYAFINDDKKERHMGLMADEVEQVAPECVSTNETSGYKAVAYPNMVALLVESIKDLRAQIEDLKAHVAI